MPVVERKYLNSGSIILAIAAIAALMHALPMGTSAPLHIEFRNGLHAPAFAILTALLFLSFRRNFSLAIAVAIATSAALLTGVLGELAQHLSYGQASASDLTRDTLGIALGLCIGFSVHSRTGAVRTRGIRAVLPAIAVTGVVLAAYPSAHAAWLIANQHHAFPSILSFDEPWETATFRVYRGASMEFQPAPESWGLEHELIARLSFAETAYSGIEIYPVSDWSEYEVFSFSAASSGDEGASITLRIDDKDHRGGFSDRFNRQIFLTPRKETFRFRIADIQDAPANRRMDSTRIRSVNIFAKSGSRDDAIILDNLRLERD